MKKFNGMEIFKFKNNNDEVIEILATTEDRRDGFAHCAYNMFGERLLNLKYYNRTWESYRYQTLLKDIVNKYGYQPLFDI